MLTKIKDVLLIIAALSVVLWVATGTSAQSPAGETTAQDQSSVTLVTTAPLLQYQGRVVDPATGEPIPDNYYVMEFRIYDVASGGTALWTETKSVEVSGGLFNTVLGDTAALTQSVFDGRELWLGITIPGDAEAVPRQQFLPVAYALSLVPGATIDGDLTINGSLNGGTAWTSANDGNGSGLDADLLDGSQASAFAASSHNHAGADISSGTVADARIASTLARDSEVSSSISSHAGSASAHHTAYNDASAVAAIKAADGAGSTLDADLLDGQDSTAFMSTTGPESISGSSSISPILKVTQTGSYYGIWGESSGSNAAVLGLNTGTGMGVYGQSVSQYGVYGYSTNSYGGSFYSVNGTALRAVGDALVTGNLTVDKVIYSAPRTHYFVIGGEGFLPGSSVNYYSNNWGMGGAYTTDAGGQALAAPVHLPHGAVVTSFRVYFYDASASSMSVSLQRLYLAGGGYTTLASVTSSGSSGYSNLTDSTISSATINNTSYSYHVRAYSTGWSSTLRIMGALITYTIAEAP